MQKLIGIPGYMNGDRSHFGVGVAYMEYISNFGVPVIITPQHVNNIPDVDMLYLPGGLDVNPVTFGAIPSYYTQNSNVLLEWWDNKILPQYLKKDTKVLAVCRSAQQIWASCGGVITQHNDWHEQSKYPEQECHTLSFTPLYKQWSKHINKVTSRHHQCMDGSGYVPDLLEVIAYANEPIDKREEERKDIVEMFKVKNKNIYGMQFHPESHSGTDELTPWLIKELLK